MANVMEMHILLIVLRRNQKEKLRICWAQTGRNDTLPLRRPPLIQNKLVIVSSFLHTVTTLNNSFYEPMTDCKLQWNLSIKDTLNKGHLSNEDTVCCPNHIELCRNLPL